MHGCAVVFHKFRGCVSRARDKLRDFRGRAGEKGLGGFVGLNALLG